MTNEEAIFDLEQFTLAPIGDGDLHRESAELALSALREQVERDKGCSWCHDEYTDAKEYSFCKHCGAKMGKRRESEVSE